MRILIIGGTGFIGSAIYARLTLKGTNVYRCPAPPQGYRVTTTCPYQREPCTDRICRPFISRAAVHFRPLVKRKVFGG